MRRSIALFLTAMIAVALAPVGATGAQVVEIEYQGSGSARVLDLDVDVPDSVFKGLTLGVSSAEFSSDPKVTGFAAGRCDYLGPNVSAVDACEASSTAESSATSASPQSGSSTPTCEVSETVAVVEILAVCGKSTSDVSSGGPAGANRGGGGTVNVSLDLSQALPGAGPQAEAAKDGAVDLIVEVITTVENQVPSQSNVDSITSHLVDHLNAIKDAQVPAVTILNGVATTDIATEGSKTTITSATAGVRIGLLGIVNPLEDGLVIIEVTGASARAVWDGATGDASAAADPGTATLKVKDVADLFPGMDYIATSVNLPQLNNLLGTLKNTPLETSIDAATVSTTDQEGRASAATSGVRVRALKGAASPNAYALDLRIAGADVWVAGARYTSDGNVYVEGASLKGGPGSLLIEPNLPKTGGPARIFFASAAILAALAIASLRIARRFRTSL